MVGWSLSVALLLAICFQRCPILGAAVGRSGSGRTLCNDADAPKLLRHRVWQALPMFLVQVLEMSL